MTSASNRTSGIFFEEAPAKMQRQEHTHWTERRAVTRRFASATAVGRRYVPLLACLLLLAGCASLPDYVPDWLVNMTGGEGKIAQRVSSSVIDAPPETTNEPDEQSAPFAPLPSEIRAVQQDLAALGYDPGPIDGQLGPMTTDAIETFQNDTGLEPDGLITPDLMVSLAKAPRPKKAPPPDIAETPEPEEALPADIAETPKPEEAPPADIAETPKPEEAPPSDIAEAHKPEEAPPADIDEAQKPEEADTEAAPASPFEDAPQADLAPQKPEEPAVPAMVVKNAGVQPAYAKGDNYIWSTGQSETVARIMGNNLIWEVNNGVRFKADRNFLIPPLTWTSPTGTGEAAARIDMGMSWPLVPGKPLVFTVEENGAIAEWNCESHGGEFVSVPAGEFETVALVCDRTPAPAGEWVSRKWMYAPAVRHYVARMDTMADGRLVPKYLVGVRPGTGGWPPAVRAGLDHMIQTTLEQTPDGEHTVWTSTVVEDEFEIKPGPVRIVAGSKRCRNFVITARNAKGTRLYPALACTDGNSEDWAIPSDPGKLPDGLSALINSG